MLVHLVIYARVARAMVVRDKFAVTLQRVRQIAHHRADLCKFNRTISFDFRYYYVESVLVPRITETLIINAALRRL